MSGGYSGSMEVIVATDQNEPMSYRYDLGPVIDHYIILKNVNKPYTQIFKPLYTQQSDIVIN